MKSRQEPSYSGPEELANSLTHGVGAVLSLVGLAAIVMVAWWQAELRAVIACAIFGATLLLAYSMSTLYHAVAGARAKRVLRVADHAAIYLLIAGTYTPLMLVSVGGGVGWALLSTVWSLAVVGVVLSVIAIHRCRVLSMILYVGMGWMVVAAGPTLVSSLSTVGLALVVAGGIAYTTGLVFYGWRRLPFHHAVWHLHVLAGSALHYLAVLHEVRLA